MVTKFTFNYTLPIRNIADNQINYPIFNDLEKNIRYTFSGKSAISLVLKYFRNNGQLGNKAEQLLVPHWMGTWIYMTIHKFCFPTTTFNHKVKGIFVYHQWGFPQKMDEILKFCKDFNLFCVEDCAHAFDGYYKNKRLGTFGDTSIFSLSKYFPSVVGGAIYSKNDKILKFVNKSYVVDNSALAKVVFDQRVKFDANPYEKKNIIDLERNYSVYDRLFACPEYSLTVVKKQIKEGAMNKRAENFDLFREAFRSYDYLEDLFSEKIYPWIIPLFFFKKNK
jgi:hypothetical protein